MTIGPENAHLRPDLGAFSQNEITLNLNTHKPLLTSLVVCTDPPSFRSQAAVVSKIHCFHFFYVKARFQN